MSLKKGAGLGELYRSECFGRFFRYAETVRGVCSRASWLAWGANAIDCEQGDHNPALWALARTVGPLVADHFG
jgi:hypothetical protein